MSRKRIMKDSQKLKTAKNVRMGKTRILRPRRDRNENDIDIETTPDQKSEINGKKHLHNRMFRAIITK